MAAVKHNQSISAALTLASSPALIETMRRHPLPDDVTELLYVFAGDQDAVRDALTWSGAREMHLQAAIDNYVQQVMVFQGANFMRVLGVRHARDRNQMRLHLRLLLKGCHPDQSGDPWRASFAARVIEAWNSVSEGQDFEEPSRHMKGRRSIGHLSFIRGGGIMRRKGAVGRFFDRIFSRFGGKKTRGLRNS